MLKVNGLFGHMQWNNFKSVALIVSFLGLFMLMQMAIWIIPHASIITYKPQFAGIAEKLRGKTQPTTTPRSFMYDQLEPELQNQQHRAAAEKAKKRNSKKLALSPRDVEPNLWGAFRLFYANSDFFKWKWALLLGIAVAWLVVATWWNSLFIRYAMRARPLDRREFPDLYNLVENLAITAGLPCPAIELIDSSALNAYASGLTPASARLGLTTGLLERLNRDELEVVIAHELTHIKTGDSRTMAVLKSCVDLVLPMVGSFTNWSGRSQFFVVALIFVIMSALSWQMLIAIGGCFLIVFLATYLAEMLVCHSREFVADAGAVELTKNPAALISALRKISRDDDLDVTGLTNKSIMFSNDADSLFATHPPVDERIEAIIEHARVTNFDVQTAMRARVPSVQRPVADDAGGRSFGRRRVGVPDVARRAAAVNLAVPADDGWRASGWQETGRKKDWQETWIVSGRADNIAHWLWFAVTLPMRLIIYFQLALLGFVLLVSAVALGLPMLIIAMPLVIIAAPLLAWSCASSERSG